MDRLIYLASKLSQQLENYLVTELEKRGINDLVISHGNVLLNLRDTKRMNYRELSKRVNKSPQTMTTLVRKLEKEDYLIIEKDPKDKRNKLVSLTKKGEDFIPVMLEISSKMYKKQYIGFTEEEEDILRVLLSKVITNFEVKE